jgi:4-hydroxy-3-methylbut-2-enyl diphosphate reductase
VELCEQKLPTWFIRDEHCLLSENEIVHFNLHNHTEMQATGYLPQKDSIRIMVTSGASCPDALVERVITRLAALTGNEAALEPLLHEWA